MCLALIITEVLQKEEGSERVFKKAEPRCFPKAISENPDLWEKLTKRLVASIVKNTLQAPRRDRLPQTISVEQLGDFIKVKDNTVFAEIHLTSDSNFGDLHCYIEGCAIEELVCGYGANFDTAIEHLRMIPLEEEDVCPDKMNDAIKKVLCPDKLEQITDKVYKRLCQ